MKEINSILDLFEIFKSSTGVCTDTRKLEKGNIYFALRGPSFNGNEFALSALEEGAILSVVDDVNLKNEARCYYVEDSLKKLQELARYYRETWKFPVLCITGSNGKTTTKELLASVLSKKFEVYSTPGNYNNHIGVPLSILGVNEKVNFVILELGANHLGEHAFLCEIARPDYGIVTNNGKDHLEGYGSLENVKKSNAELFEFLKLNDGFAFVNSDDQDLESSSKGIKRISYGLMSSSEVKGEIITHELFASLSLEDGSTFKSKLMGEYNAYNILAAISVGKYFDLTTAQIQNGIADYEPKLNRSELLEFKDFKIYLDAYNSNPNSLGLALKTLENLDIPRKMVILGGMRELGNFEKEEHSRVINLLADMDLEYIWLIGPEFEVFKDFDSLRWFENHQNLKISFDELEFKKGIILIKGSRKYHLESLLSD